MVRHIEVYGTMDRTVRDKLKEFLQDPTAVTPDDLKKFPKEVFTSLSVGYYGFIHQNKQCSPMLFELHSILVYGEVDYC